MHCSVVLRRWMVVGSQPPPLPDSINRIAPSSPALTTTPIYGPGLTPHDPLSPVTSTISEMHAIRRIVMDTTQMKRTHLQRQNESLAQEARRRIASVNVAASGGTDSVGALSPRSVIQLLANACYFGFNSNDAIVQQCTKWIRTHLGMLKMEDIGAVIFACAAVQSKDAKQIIECVASRTDRASKYMNSSTITTVLSAFAKVRYSNEKLFFGLTRRIMTLCRIGGFEKNEFVPLLDSVARARIRSTPLTTALMYRIQCGTDPLMFPPEEMVMVIYAFARLRLRDEKFIKRLSGRTIGMSEHLSALQLTSVLNSFSILGYKFESMISALTTRCSEVMNDFSARYVAIALQSFRRLHVNSPELFDALAERALAVVPQHTARDIAAVVSSLEFFSLADEELFQKLSEHALTVVHDFSALGIVEVLHAFARIQYRHVPLLTCLWDRCRELLPLFDASGVRRVLYSVARFQAHISHQALANALFQRALILHPELFLSPESIQEADVVFQVFGKEYCPDLYAFFLSRSAAIAASPPPPPRTARSLDARGRGRGRGRGGGRGRGRGGFRGGRGGGGGRGGFRGRGRGRGGEREGTGEREGVRRGVGGGEGEGGLG